MMANSRNVLAAVLSIPALLGTVSGCATLAGSWEYGLPKDQASTEDRLWHIVFPLAVAAADTCVFKREETYGLFLNEEAPGKDREGRGSAGVVVRFVHPQLPAGKAGMAIGDAIMAINGDPLAASRPEPVSDQIQRLTRARIQPLTLGLRRGASERLVSLWSVPSCRMNVKLIANPVVNAFSDGANIYLTTGLLEFVRSPDQLAWVVAHEVGHHVLEHAETAKFQMMLNRFLGSRGGEQPQRVEQIELERQADLYAVDLMTRAGFDLREGRRLVGWLQVLQAPPSETNLGRSHPTNQERLEALDAIIQRLDEKKAQSSTSR
jgi:peptidase M48-like protein/PDZ domain-containing protein